MTKKQPLVVLDKRIELLVSSKEDFISFLKNFYKENPFTESCYFFHNKTIGVLEKNNYDYEQIFENDKYFEYLYATLVSWGMDDIRGGAKLEKFEIFRDSIKNQIDIIKNLHELENEINQNSKKIKDNLSKLFDELKIMKSNSKLVGVSKALHHILPNLIVPIDRKYTLNFFYIKDFIQQNDKHKGEIKQFQITGNEKEIFFELFDRFVGISKRLREIGFTKKDFCEPEIFDTSLSKVIDNAIICWIRQEQKLFKLKM